MALEFGRLRCGSWCFVSLLNLDVRLAKRLEVFYGQQRHRHVRFNLVVARAWPGEVMVHQRDRTADIVAHASCHRSAG